MKIIFFSNYLNHHQLPFCLAMNELTDGQFVFVATNKISNSRIELGYRDMDSEYSFVIKEYETKNVETVEQLVLESDVAIFGDCPEKYIRMRMEKNLLSFRIHERVYKTGIWKALSPRGIYYMVKNHTTYRNKELYMLCASAYTAYDFNLMGAYKNKCFKWGYFPEVKPLDVNKLIERRRGQEPVRILWVGRLIDLKKPQHTIEIAKRLKVAGYNFDISIIGTGNLAEDLQKEIECNQLTQNVKLLGSMKPEEVRTHMEKADIFLFTSNFQEGWGAVLNEAMNSACAIVASHAIGAVPFLINNGVNGLIYKNGDIDDLYIKVTKLLDDPILREKFGIEAYKTVSEVWNGRIAAKRLLQLSENILDAKEGVSFSDGPCSKAELLSNNWFKAD